MIKRIHKSITLLCLKYINSVKITKLMKKPTKECFLLKYVFNAKKRIKIQNAIIHTFMKKNTIQNIFHIKYQKFTGLPSQHNFCLLQYIIFGLDVKKHDILRSHSFICKEQ